MNVNRVVFAVSVVLLVLVIGAYSTPGEQAPTKQVALSLVPHLSAGMPEQDVFVEDPENPDLVCRISPEEDVEAYLDQPLYSVPNFVEHDLFQVGPSPIGPYEKGAEMGFSLRQWLAASGSGAYTATGNEAQLELSFQNLVPQGVYTMWCGEITFPPNVQTFVKPCGAYDGSQSLFMADAQGNAEIYIPLQSLPESTEETVQVVAAAYHSDANTYGPYLGNFGVNSHVQLLGFVPAPEDDAWQVFTDAKLLAQNR